jgi:hypothetical protein
METADAAGALATIKLCSSIHVAFWHVGLNCHANRLREDGTLEEQAARLGQRRTRNALSWLRKHATGQKLDGAGLLVDGSRVSGW